MAKFKILSYRQPMFQALNASGQEYRLEILKLYLFGLVMRKSTISVTVPYTAIDKYEAHWDRIIKSGAIVRD